MVDIIDLRRGTPEYAGDERGSKKQRVIDLLSPFRRSNDLLASLFLLFDLTAFVALTAVLVRSANHRMAPFLSAAIAVFIARLFIVGHDCCHGAFFSGSRANAMCGRIAMLPGLVPFSPWAVGHNTLHHGYTGLRTRDYTFQPLSAGEYLALSSFERLFYRLSRTPPGVAFYWIRELWWKKLLAPDREKFPSLNRRIHKRDRLLVLLFLIAWTTCVCLGRGAGTSVWAAGFWAILAPTLLWSWIMGFTIFVHHTGPQMVWFADRKQWSFFESQFRLTPNLFPPKVLSVCLHNIYCHLPHHLDVSIPFYRLEPAMETLRRHFPGEIVERPLTLCGIRESFRTCHLFDFEKSAWVTFGSLAGKEEQ